jgi:hypothetical protein
MDASNREDSIRRLAETVLEQYPLSLKQITPHPECTLLQRHKNNAATTPFSYIGVLKPTCYACSLYLEAYTRSNPPIPLSIRDTRGHVHAWQAPGDDTEEDLYADMLEKIQRLLGNIVRQFALERAPAFSGPGGDIKEDYQMERCSRYTL